MAENQQQQVPVDTKYLPELMAEKDSIDPSFVHAVRLITNEIDRIQNPQGDEKSAGAGGKQDAIVDTNEGRPVKHSILLKVPVDKHPNFNYVGRLLGPGGSTLKGIQTTTSTQIAILGKGSMRDKKKAEELAAGGDAKFQHLNLPLHVKVTSVSTLDQALLNISGAVSELLKLMQPTNEDEMMLSPQAARGMGQRGGMRGRGGRGAAAGRGGTGRGGGMRGGRGGASQRGSGGARGRGAAGGRGGYGKAQDPYASAAGGYEYSPLESYEGYGTDYSTEATYDAYGQESYATDLYAAEAGYGDASYGTDYGYGDASYDAYGNGADASGQYGAVAQQSSKPYRGKMRGGSSRGRGSSKPY